MDVGVLCNPKLKKSERAALRNVSRLDDVEITQVVVDASRRDDKTYTTGTRAINQGSTVSLSDVQAFIELFRKRRFRAFLHVDQKLGWLLFNETKLKSHLQFEPVKKVEVINNADVIECYPVSLEDGWQTLPEKVTTLIAQKCDVVIRFGFGLLKGDILSAPKHGVISVHGSDIRKYRGLGPKMTFLRGEETVAVTLQQLSETIDGGKIIEIATKNLHRPYTLDDINAAVEELKTQIFATGINNLRDPGFVPDDSSLGKYYGHKVVQNPKNVAKLIAKNNLARVQKRI
jgi:methionyl-tRNA formyltransferase